MMSRYHGSKSFGSQESFLTETAIYTVKRWKKSMGYHFVPESSQAQESHTKMSIFSVFFSAIFSGPRSVETQIFCYHHGHVT